MDNLRNLWARMKRRKALKELQKAVNQFEKRKEEVVPILIKLIAATSNSLCLRL
jgi:hypothetical protein